MQSAFFVLLDQYTSPAVVCQLYFSGFLCIFESFPGHNRDCIREAKGGTFMQNRENNQNERNQNQNQNQRENKQQNEQRNQKENRK